MFKTFKLATVLAGMALLAAGAAHALPVPAGTLGISSITAPTVNTTSDTVTLGGIFGYQNGTGVFGGDATSPPYGSIDGSTYSINPLTGRTSLVANNSVTLSFAAAPGSVINYDGVSSDPTAVNNLLTFYDTDDNGNILETYVFDLDQSITTVSATTTGLGLTVDLYLLGDMTATGTEGNFNDLTPTALTLQLNTTGGSNWTYSATLANPPPGTGTAVPEPASMVLLGGGLAALGMARRRRKQ